MKNQLIVKFKKDLFLLSVFAVCSTVITILLKIFIFSNDYGKSSMEILLLGSTAFSLAILLWLHRNKFDNFFISKENNNLILVLAIVNYGIWGYQFIRILSSPFSSWQSVGLVLYIASAWCYFTKGRNFYISTYIMSLYLWRQDTWIFTSDYDWADMSVPICLSNLLLIHTLANLLLSQTKGRLEYWSKEINHTFVAFVGLVVVSAYGLGGLFKITAPHETALSVLKQPFFYILHNQIINLMVYYFNSGMDVMYNFPALKELVVKVFTTDLVVITINFIVVVMEAGIIFGILFRRFFVYALATMIIMHFLLFSLSGLFFWKWILIDGVLIVFTLKKKINLFHKPRLYFACLLPFYLISGAHNSILLKKVFLIPNLGWFDGAEVRETIDDIGWFYVKQDDDGKTYLISGINPNLFYPFEKNMTQVWNHKESGNNPVLAQELDRFLNLYAPRLCEQNDRPYFLLNHIWNFKALFANPFKSAEEADAIALVSYRKYLNESLLGVKKTNVLEIIYRYPIPEVK